MKVRDLMTTDPITTTPDAPLKEAARIMVREKISGLPVMKGAKVVGIVTEGDFLRQEANRDQPYRLSLLEALFGEGGAEPAVETVGEVMTEPVITITPDATVSEAARVMSHRKVKRLPVLDDDGNLIGVISRADVVNAFTKPDEVIEDEVREDIVRRLLFLEPDVIGVSVDDGVVTLSGELENRTEAHLLEELTRRIAGVVRVVSDLTYEVDDQRIGKSYPLG
ncbi:MAG: CBS domain-containing protein [Actinomycetota bacterium]|jgi:CBS domain-containing protein|nr:CBS domain-containing protein [Actinomycetota bacterium]